MYKNATELMKICKNENKRIWQVALENEQIITGASREEILIEFRRRYEIMSQSATKALEHGLPTKGNLITGSAKCQNDYSKGDTISGSFINRVMSYAYSSSEVNNSMGKICAAPTAGSCGILPAVLLGVKEEKDISYEKTIEGLVTASAVGTIFTRNATVAGADGGCQAECGVAASMAAAATVHMLGGDDEKCLNAASFAMINIMGLVCDTVAGLVQIPCAQRNASGAVNALISADMAMAGQTSHIPFDEVVEAMFEVGKMLPPQLRETAKGGIAATETGQRIKKDIFMN